MKALALGSVIRKWALLTLSITAFICNLDAQSEKPVHTRDKVYKKGIEPPIAPGDPYVFGPNLDQDLPTGDPQIPYCVYPAFSPGTKAIRLYQLIDEAFRRNPQTHQSWEKANATAANLLVAKGAYYPNITLGAAIKPSYNHTPDYPGQTRRQEVDYTPQATLAWLLFDFGARDATTESARFNLLADDFANNQIMQAVALQVVKNYYLIQQERKAVQVYAASEKFFKSLEGIHVEDNKKVDKQIEEENSPTLQEAPDVDVVRKYFSEHKAFLSEELIGMDAKVLTPKLIEGFQKAKASVMEALTAKKAYFKNHNDRIAAAERQGKYNLDRASADYVATMIQLSQSIGLPGNILVRAAEPTGPIPIKKIDGELDSLIDLARRRRPDLANAFAASAASYNTAKAADANRFPTINLSVSVGATNANTITNKNDPSSFSRTQTNGWAENYGGAGLSFSFTAFDGGILLNKAKAAHFSAEAAKANLANVELNAISDVATNYYGYLWAKRIYVDAKSLWSAAKDAADGAAVQFAGSKTISGSTNTQDLNALLDARAQSDSAEIGLTSAEMNVYLLSYQLANSTGVTLSSIKNGDLPAVTSIPVIQSSDDRRKVKSSK